MTVKHRYKSFLRLISPRVSEKNQYQLLPGQTIVIGRDPSCCEIVLDSEYHLKVSRQHLQIRPLPSQSRSDMPRWEVCDLKSRNGTYVNGQRLQSCQTLEVGVGDHIQLGHNGAELIFECQEASIISLTEIFPVVSKKVNLVQNGYLVPGVITVLCVVAMLATRGSQIFFYVLAAYLAAAIHYFIHKLCHKHKPWWLLVASALATSLPLLTDLEQFKPVFFDFLPGYLSNKEENIFAIILKSFVGPGLSEELFKALPVLLIYFFGRLLKSPKRELIGVWEPLDGIIVATASATGFALVETLIEVVEEKDDFAGLTLLIPRILGDISGQVAYSGYFGYFIGLSALKPSKRWRFLGIGYLTSAVIHALAAVVIALQQKQKLELLTGNLLLALIGSLAYVFLMAAILKSRQLSPTYSRKLAH